MDTRKDIDRFQNTKNIVIFLQLFIVSFHVH